MRKKDVVVGLLLLVVSLACLYGATKVHVKADISTLGTVRQLEDIAEDIQNKQDVKVKSSVKVVPKKDTKEVKRTRPKKLVRHNEKETKLLVEEEMTLTAYCSCSKCCGKTDGITASGTKATEGRTVAVDVNKIPFGTKVYINGNEYIAEDKGGAVKGNHIDIYFESHERALEFGKQTGTVRYEVK